MDPDIRAPEHRNQQRLSWLLGLAALASGGAHQALVVSTTPDMAAVDSVAILTTFFAVLAVHSGLYWISPRLTVTRTWSIAYLVVQYGLAITLTVAFQPSKIAVFFFALITVQGAALHVSRWAVFALLGASVGIVSMYSSRSPLGVVLFLSLAALVVYIASLVRQLITRRETQKLLRGYAGEIEHQVLTTERQRLARDLHDTLAQGLVGVTLQLEAVDAYLTTGRTRRAQEVVEQTMKLSRRTLAEARSAIDGVRALSDESGLESSLRKEILRFSVATGIHCTPVIHVPDGVPQAVAEHSIRIVAEVLTNVARHASATEIAASVDARDGCLLINVRDNGIGFDPEAPGEAEGHYGIIGIRERASSVGGSVAIESRSGDGTTVRCELPLNPHRESGGLER